MYRYILYPATHVFVVRAEKHAEELKLKTEGGTEFTVYTYKPVQNEPRV